MKILAVTPRSVTAELENTRSPYFSGGEFEIILNGNPVKKERRNVFSLFSLEHDSEYRIEANGETAVFKTAEETGFYDVRRFNAYGDGSHDDTPAFTAAIHCLPYGATLYVSAGVYNVKQLFLKSGITLYLGKGAVLKGAAVRSDYPVLPACIDGANLGTWQGEEADCFASLITAVNCENVNIIGEGVIDCNALAGDWYVNHRVKRGAWRPRGVFLNGCKNVILQGLTVKNTPSWNIHPYFCKNVKIYDCLLKNPPSMPTTDGIDPDCCDGVDIAGVDISVGDDCVALKSGSFEFAKKRKTPCKNVCVRNCLMREGHGGVVLGSELSGGIENVTVSKCIFEGTDRGLRIKTRRGRGSFGKCGDVVFSDIIMKDVKVPFVINAYYNMGDENGHTEYVWTTEKLPVDERTPKIGAFGFINMKCTGVEYGAGSFYGLPESPVESVLLKNVAFVYNPDAEAGYPDMKEKNTAVRKQGLDFCFVKSVTLDGVSFDGQDGEEVILNGVESFIKKG